ncbi:MAG TPA: hypothetical protein DIC60_04825 [Lachnospiraceae bacterium]|nr:hypothetical protein [Lachnospiraceae bacterium]
MYKYFDQPVKAGHEVQVYEHVGKDGGACSVLNLATQKKSGKYDINKIFTLNNGDLLNSELLNSIINIFKARLNFLVLDYNKLPEKITSFIRENIMKARNSKVVDNGKPHEVTGWVVAENVYIECALNAYDGLDVDLRFERKEVNNKNTKESSKEMDAAKVVGGIKLVSCENEFILENLEYIKDDQHTTVMLSYDENYNIRSILEIWNRVGDDKPKGYRFMQKVGGSTAFASEEWSLDDIGGGNVKTGEVFYYSEKYLSKEELIEAMNGIILSEDGVEFLNGMSYAHEKFESEKRRRRV